MRMAAQPVMAPLRERGLLAPLSRSRLRTLIPLPALEVGPFDAPFLQGPSVKYFDILDQQQLRERAVRERRNPDGCPFIHFTGRLADIPQRFQAVFSAHTVEHTPDLIGHLRDVANLLRPGGSYFLIVPDKRYCFDHFLPESTLAQVLVGQGRLRPTLDAVRDHLTCSAHNIAPLHWLGIHGKPGPIERAERELAEAERGQYVDVHQWLFTPASFLSIVSKLGIFKRVEVHDTAFGELEFVAILSL